MPVTISNSSPIIHLAKINQLELLHDLFGTIIIPFAVYKECVVEGKGRKEVKEISAASWIQVINVKDRNLVKLLCREIDNGESEAIALALEQQAGLILLDDAEAREKARLYRMPITGTIGVLLRAKREGKIDSLKGLLSDLSSTGFWISDKLMKRLLAEAGE